jgi:hypothetical protein
MESETKASPSSWLVGDLSINHEDGLNTTSKVVQQYRVGETSSLFQIVSLGLEYPNLGSRSLFGRVAVRVQEVIYSLFGVVIDFNIFYHLYSNG